MGVEAIWWASCKVREYRSNIHSDPPFDMPTFGLARYWQSPSSREKLSQNCPPVLSKAPEQGSRLGTICDVIGSFSGGPRRMCCNRSVVISWPSRDAVGIFWKPTFYPNHRARNHHP